VLQAWATARNRRITIVLGAVCLLAIAAALAVGLSDNPPGIALAFVGALAAVLAFVHPWRAARKFWMLVGISLAAFVVLVLVHNVAEVVASRSGTGSMLGAPLSILSGAAFVAALFLCPAGCMVGVIGGVVMLARNSRKDSESEAPV